MFSNSEEQELKINIKQQDCQMYLICRQQIKNSERRVQFKILTVKKAKEILTLGPTLNFSLFYGDPEQISRYQEEGFHFPQVSNKAKFRNVNTKGETA